MGTTLVLSDLHLGHPASYLTDPGLLAPLLAGVDTLVLNGDAIEEINPGCRSAAWEKGQQLVDVCKRLGVRLVSLAGNHDPGFSSAYYLDWGPVFITHGDAIHPGVAPWSNEVHALARERQRLVDEIGAPTNLDKCLELVKRQSMVACLDHFGAKRGIHARGKMLGKFARQPQRALRALSFWLRTYSYALAFRNRYRPMCPFMLIGHTHRPRIHRGADFTLINTGSFQPLSGALAVRLQADRMEIHAVRRDKVGFQLSRQVANFALAPVQPFAHTSPTSLTR